MAHGHSTPSTVNHSAQCRARLTEAIASTPAGQARLDKLTEKENSHLSEQVKQQVEGDPAPAQGGLIAAAEKRLEVDVKPTYKINKKRVENMIHFSTKSADELSQCKHNK